MKNNRQKRRKLISTDNKSPLPLTDPRHSLPQAARPAVLYTNVDGQCDKLVTDTVTSLPHWPSN